MDSAVSKLYARPAEPCVECGAPAVRGPYKDPICEDCARRLGQLESEALNRARAAAALVV
jgi:hypothetical protein